MFKGIIRYFTNMREKEREEMKKKSRAQFEQRARERARMEKEDIKKRNQRNKEENMKLRRTFTTIEEYKRIAGDKLSKLDKLPQHERDVVAKRVIKLCKEDEKFRKDIEAWAKSDYQIAKHREPMSQCAKQKCIRTI